MPTWLIIILLAILAVGLFVLAMSLTLIFKGHHIDSEISTNENMRKLGIKCAVQETPLTDGGTRRLRIGARMLGQLRRLHPRSGSRSTRLRKKIIGDKFSANRKHG